QRRKRRNVPIGMSSKVPSTHSFTISNVTKARMRRCKEGACTPVVCAISSLVFDPLAKRLRDLQLSRDIHGLLHPTPCHHAHEICRHRRRVPSVSRIRLSHFLSLRSIPTVLKPTGLLT